VHDVMILLGDVARLINVCLPSTDDKQLKSYSKIKRYFFSNDKITDKKTFFPT